MQKIIMLGTGHGAVYHTLESCFLLQNDEEYFLVDTGGKINVIENMKKCGVTLDKIHNIFISPTHTDHLLGFFWILKVMGGLIKSGKHNGEIHVYCNKEVADAIQTIYPYLYPEPKVDLIKKHLDIVVVQDNETVTICNRDYTFFDVKARGNLLYGFETLLDSKERFVFLGDETLDSSLYSKIEGAGYVMHEAFCLDAEKDIFKPYEKHHSTVKSVCSNFKDLHIKNIILYHTEESHEKNRKKLYLEEARKYYSGNVIVPNDMEIIEIGGNN